MSHIDEGVLHAHLDGALRPGQADWAAAEAHLDVCHDCRRRLVEAREIRDGAAALLAGTSPGPLPRPSFQQLAAAGTARRVDVSPAPVPAPARPRRPRWWNSPGRLAWAASLVLAVGAGWIGRQFAVEENFELPTASVQKYAEGQAARDDVGGSYRDDTDQANEAGQANAPRATDEARRARQADEHAPADRLARDESDLRKQETAAPPGEAVAASPRRGLAESAAEPDAERAGAQLARPDAGREAEGMMAKAASGALCYVGGAAGAGDASGARDTDNLADESVAWAGAGGPGASLALERIRLGADRTAGALVGGVAYVGYWADVGEDSIDVRISDGKRQLVLSLGPDGTAMYGTLAASGGAPAPTAGVAAGGAPITLEAATCPTDP